MAAVQDEKRLRRAEARARIAAEDAAVRRTESMVLCAELRTFLHEVPGVIGAFAPRADEAAILPLCDALLAAGRTVAFPRVVEAESRMEFHAVASTKALVAGYRRLLEPPERGSSAPVPPEAFGAVLVPGLLFDLEGGRLGRGGGYYDRFLASLPPHVHTIGLAFGCQMVHPHEPPLPVEPHDARLGWLATSAWIRRVAPKEVPR